MNIFVVDEKLCLFIGYHLSQIYGLFFLISNGETFKLNENVYGMNFFVEGVSLSRRFGGYNVLH